MKTPSRLIILLAGLVLCTVCGVLYAWSIFVVPLEQAFGWQRPETSLTFPFMITFFSLGMFAGGKLLRFGPARAVQIGGALLCVGLLWASRIDSVIGLYLSYGVVSGFGIGIVNLVPAAVCLRWYPERKGLVSGLLTMAPALGTLPVGRERWPLRSVRSCSGRSARAGSSARWAFPARSWRWRCSSLASLCSARCSCVCPKRLPARKRATASACGTCSIRRPIG